ncbi:MAG TPA: cobalt transporter CbiM [Patescibacteria group bacterium]|nr:cobalt transporter CbiM [Patescibacteria group bacterium]
MHIPDGYLSPQTEALMAAATAPFLVKASRQLEKKYNKLTLPLVGVFGAFSFLIMMFNLPLPGGTTGHAVGTVITALVLGPWLSMVSVTLALVIQAFFFGDGGILALGANIFNMAVVMSIVGYGLFLLLKKITQRESLEPFLAAVSGYIAINVAAFCAGVELGLQPLLFHSSNGHALYFPYPLAISVPAMMIGHLALAGLAEGFITFFAYSWIQRRFPKLLHQQTAANLPISWKPIVLGIAVLIVIAPIGLLAHGTAWGEWGRAELFRRGLSYIPQGFDRWNSIWSAPLSGYNLPLLHNSAAGYIVSALSGVILILAIVAISIFVSRRIRKKRTSTTST